MPFAIAVVRLIFAALFFITLIRRMQSPRRSKPVRVRTTADVPEYPDYTHYTDIVPPFNVPPLPPPSGRRKLLFVVPEEDVDVDHWDGDHESVMNEARDWEDEYHDDTDDDDAFEDDDFEISAQARMLHLVDSQEEKFGGDEDDYGYLRVLERFTEFIDMNENEYEVPEADEGDYIWDSREGEEGEKDFFGAVEEKGMHELLDDFNNTRVFEMYRKLGKEHEEQIERAAAEADFSEPEVDDMENNFTEGCGPNGEGCAGVWGGLIGE